VSTKPLQILAKELGEALAKGTPAAQRQVQQIGEEIVRRFPNSPQAASLGRYLGIGGTGAAATTAGVAAAGAGEIAERVMNEALDPLSQAAAQLEASLGVQIPKSVGDIGAALIELRVKLDDLRVDVGRTTGLFTKLGADLEIVTEQNRKFGATIERTAKVMMELDTGLSTLGVTSVRSRRETIRLATALENLGVAASDTGAGLEVFARGTALSEEASRKSVERLIQLGRQISYKGGPAQMMKDIAEIGPMIAKFGTGSEQVMADLAVQARKTGLQMRQIFDVSDQFDTFEGALEAAGKLNAQFGLGLSSVALNQMDDAERREVIVQRFHSLYGSFDNLDKRQKQFMAEALGFGKNIQDARKYFEETDMFPETVDSLTNAAQEQVKMSEIAGAAQEKFLLEGANKLLGEQVQSLVTNMQHSFKNFDTSVRMFEVSAGIASGGGMLLRVLGQDKAAGAAQAMAIIAGAGVGAATTTPNRSLPPIMAGAGGAGAGAAGGGGGAGAGGGGAGGGGGGGGADPATGMTPLQLKLAAGGGLGIGFATDVAGSRLGRNLPDALKGLNKAELAELRKLTPQQLDDMVLGKVSSRRPLPGGGFGRMAPDAATQVTDQFKRAKVIQEAGKEGGESLLKQAGRASRFKPLLKGAGKFTMGVADFAFAEAEARENIALGEDPTKARTREFSGATGALGGAVAGAKAGAALAGGIGLALGSVAPGIGNAIGGAIGVGIGTIIGGGLGAFGGEKLVESFFEPGPAAKAEKAAEARAERQEANKAMDEALRRNRQAKDGAVGDQASLTGKQILNVNIDGVQRHQQDITAFINPTGTKRHAKDTPFDINATQGMAEA
jgi:hypothetical protein